MGDKPIDAADISWGGNEAGMTLLDRGIYGVVDITGLPYCGQCGQYCWKVYSPDYNPEEPCWGKIGISEDFPGSYTHFCEGHGHPEDKQPYKPRPKESRT